MSDTDHIDEDEVLRRMLSTPPKPHKPLSDQRDYASLPREQKKAARRDD